MTTYFFLDTEYRNSAQETLEAVAASYIVRRDGVEIDRGAVWVYKDTIAQQELANILLKYHAEQATFLSYNWIAEGRFCLALGIDTSEWKIVDLLLEAKQCRNWSKHTYGKYLSAKGEAKTSHPPDLDDRGKPIYYPPKHPKKKNNSKIGLDLGSTLYHYTDVLIDLNHKNAMRDIILKGKYTEEIKNKILKYAMDDVIYLPELFKVLQKEIRTLTKQTFQDYLTDSAYPRGEFAARTAKIESQGIPVDVPRLKRIRDSRPIILDEWTGKLNSEHFPFFVKNSKGKYVFSDEQKQKFVASKGLEKEWKKSKLTGKFSYDKETLSDWEDILPEIKELVRLRSFDSQTKSYSVNKSNFIDTNFLEEHEEEAETEGKESIFDRIGEDDRLRVYFNPFSTQSARNAPPARSFLLAQSRWVRSCMRPKKGFAITGIDYSSQEFLIAGLEGNDTNMLTAYNYQLVDGTYDIYLGSAIMSDMAPKDATKKTHKELRNYMKTVILGLQFGLGMKKLARKLQAESSAVLPPDVDAEAHYQSKAAELISWHKETFRDYWDYVAEKLWNYEDGTPLRTREGWYLFCENPNPLSVSNFPIQSQGAAILHRAVRHGHHAGIKIIATLHDAVYFEHEEGDTQSISVMRECMQQGFRDYYPTATVRMDHKTWNSEQEYIEGDPTTFTLLAKHIMSDLEYANWPLCTNIIS